MKDSEYHIPVLLHAATSALIKNINGNYVDVTFGGGGHSKQILKLIQKGRLISLIMMAMLFPMRLMIQGSY
tara:strand:- start:134 stop:346 length:213 start_codon:yes stop_codon:yes gene_type:complete